MIRPEHHAALRPYLLPGERLLWSGGPKRGILLRAADLYIVPFSLLWIGFVGFWNVGAHNADAPFFFEAVGILFFLVGLYFLLGRFLHDAWLRSRLVYAVSDRRVIILRTGPFPKLRAIELRYLPSLELVERRGGRGTILFDTPRAADLLNGQVHLDWVPANSRIPQFVDLDGARAVYELIGREGERIRVRERVGAQLTA